MNEISLSLLWNILKKAWIVILAITLVVMIAAAAFTHYFIPKKYSSSVKCYVVNINTDYAYTTTNLLDASKYLINDYVAIIKSDRLLLPICEELSALGYTDITPASIRSERMISGGTDAVDTGVFTITVSHTNKDLAYDLAAIIAEKAPEMVTKIARPELNLKAEQKDEPAEDEEIVLNCFEVLSFPTKAVGADSPSLISNTMIAGIAAAVVTYFVFFVYYLLKARITSEDDIKKAFNIPVIGRIPTWEQSESN